MSYGVLACITNSECCRKYRGKRKALRLSSPFHMFVVVVSVHFLISKISGGCFQTSGKGADYNGWQTIFQRGKPPHLHTPS